MTAFAAPRIAAPAIALPRLPADRIGAALEALLLVPASVLVGTVLLLAWATGVVLVTAATAPLALLRRSAAA